MSDGKSLEHTGVTPDEMVLPSAQDLANGRDPTLAYAAQVLGTVWFSTGPHVPNRFVICPHVCGRNASASQAGEGPPFANRYSPDQYLLKPI